MSTSSEKARRLIELYTNGKPFDQVLRDLSPTPPEDLPESPDLPGTLSWGEEAKAKRIHLLQESCGVDLPALRGESPAEESAFYKGNIENFIGLTQIPTGVIGPLHIRGTRAQGDFYVPMATTEGALVASYHRGARATRVSGGITAVCTTEGVQRTPVWKFNTLPEVGQFMFWMLQQQEVFKKIVGEHSRFAVLQEMKINMEGNQVLTIFEYTCGEAAGQNMATICTAAICNYIVEHTPIQPQHWFVESNYSGDKKATAVSFSTVRGKKVTAEAVIKKEVALHMLHCTPEKIAVYWQSSTVAAAQSGSIGVQGHFANGLTALFLATGQDAACISEAHVGITRMEVNGDGDLYVAITLPALVVGTVGGGTRLPTQQECLKLLGCTGTGSARKLAEICGAVALAGEVSIAAALASGEFSKAHQLFRRNTHR